MQFTSRKTNKQKSNSPEHPANCDYLLSYSVIQDY